MAFTNDVIGYEISSITGDLFRRLVDADPPSTPHRLEPSSIGKRFKNRPTTSTRSSTPARGWVLDGEDPDTR